MYLLYLFGDRSDGSDTNEEVRSNETRIALAIRTKGSQYKCHSDIINAHIGELTHVLDTFDANEEKYQKCIKNKTDTMRERKAKEAVRSTIRSSQTTMKTRLAARKEAAAAAANPFSKGNYSYQSQKQSPNRVSPNKGGTRKKRKHRKTRKAKR